MALLVWSTLGIAIWHFSIFIPDKFRGGIIGTFVAAVVGSMISGAIVQLALGRGIGETDLLTFFAAIPGCVIALGIDWYLGHLDHERELAEA